MAVNSSQLDGYFRKLFFFFFIVTKNELVMHKQALEEELNILADKNTAPSEGMYHGHKP